eukprot:s3098_g2.t3
MEYVFRVFNWRPRVPVKVAIRHLAPDLDTYVATARYTQEKIDLRTDQALAEAIEACAQATSSLCSSTAREASKTMGGRYHQDVAQLCEELGRRLTRLEQRIEAMDEVFLSRHGERQAPVRQLSDEFTADLRDGRKFRGAALAAVFVGTSNLWLLILGSGMTSCGLPLLPAPRRFSEHANWLIPGRLMLGRYPFVSPVYCPSLPEGHEQLRSLLEVGINTFVCLQSELPAQEVAWPREGVAVPGFPGAFQPYSAVAREESTAELQFLHSPIADLGTPGLRELSALVRDLKERILRDEKIYLHCWGGRGRSGVVGACLLGSLDPSLSAEEALDFVQRGYSARGSALDVGALSRSPQTSEQRDFENVQQKVVNELKSQLDQRLTHLACQVEDVARSQSALQADLQSLASKVQRPMDAADYEMALRKLTSNMEDIRSLIAVPVSPRRGSRASSPPPGPSPGSMGTMVQSSRPWHEALPTAVACAKCGSAIAADANFCRRCGAPRPGGAGAPAGAPGRPMAAQATTSPCLPGSMGSVGTGHASPGSFQWQMR